MKTREEMIIEEIELSFLDVIGTAWGLTIGTDVNDDKMKYFNNKGIEIRNELIKKIGKILSSPEKKEEVHDGYCPVCNSCGVEGCCKLIPHFIDKHIRGKSGCKYEDEYISEIEYCYNETYEVEKQETTQEFTKEELRYIRELINDGAGDIRDRLKLKIEKLLK